MAWLAGYSWRKKITIVGTVDGEQTDYQMKLNVHKGANGDDGDDVYLDSLCRDDFNDIRFTTSDGETELDHWRESYVSGTSAVFWIKFDTIADDPGSSYFYIYYYDTDATSGSNGAATFIEFDDFERGNNGDLVGGDWTDVTGSVKISTAQKYAGTRSVEVKDVAGVDAYARLPITAGDNVAVQCRVFQPTGKVVERICHSAAADWSVILYIAGGAIQYYDGGWHAGGAIGQNQWQLLELRKFTWAGAHTYNILVEGVVVKEGADLWNTTFAADELYVLAATADHYFYLDNVLARNFTATEPTWGAWGKAEPLIEPEGIASAEAFGEVRVGPVLEPSGIASLEAFGALVVAGPITCSGIASLEAFGTAKLNLTIYPLTILTAEAFGALLIGGGIVAIGIVSEEAFGTAVVAGPISVDGIESEETFGVTILAGPITVTGIASLEAIGALSVVGASPAPTRLEYILELHDSDGTLVAILNEAYNINHTQLLNSPHSLTFLIKGDDSKLSYLTLAREIWLRNYATGQVIRKFKLTERTDSRV